MWQRRFGNGLGKRRSGRGAVGRGGCMAGQGNARQREAAVGGGGSGWWWGGGSSGGMEERRGRRGGAWRGEASGASGGTRRRWERLCRPAGARRHAAVHGSAWGERGGAWRARESWGNTRGRHRDGFYSSMKRRGDRGVMNLKGKWCAGNGFKSAPTGADLRGRGGTWERVGGGGWRLRASGRSVAEGHWARGKPATWSGNGGSWGVGGQR